MSVTVARRAMARARRIPSRIRRLPVTIGYYRGPRLMSDLRRRWVLLRNPHATIRFEGPVYLGPGFSLHMPHGGTFIVGPGVEFRRDFRAELANADSRIVIGAACALTYSVVMQCATTIELGDRVMLGQSTLVVDGNHRYRDLSKPMLAQGYDYRAIRIGDDATITTKCTIVNSIGTRSVIGANAVVTKPVPPYCVAGGVPARVLDYFGPPGEEPPELAPSSERSG